MAERHKLLLESPQLQEEEVPHLSANSSSGSYVLFITSLASHYAAVASAPANVIDLFDKTTLKGVQTLPGHEFATTSLHSVDNVAGVSNKCLISSGRDGSVKIWDNRSNSHSIKSECPSIW
jgi:WD40 repeat protein